MPGDLLLPRPDCRLRAGCPPGDVCPFRSRPVVGRLAGVIDGLCWPLLGGVAAWAQACRVTRLLAWVKPTADQQYLELDLIA